MKTNTRIVCLLSVILLGRGMTWAAGTCEVCGAPFSATMYTWEDKVARAKKVVCERCVTLTTVCYVCGVPVFRGFTQLPDGRVLCPRDLRSVVLDETEATQLCNAAAEAVDRQFSRFITFPRANVRLGLMDRLHLQEMFKLAGNDLSCPNVWGCTTRQTNDHQRTYQISLLSGLPRDLLKATSVHEHAHVWISENLSAARRRAISPEAVEGFCELVSYLAMQAQQEAGMLGVIRSNRYTRGQILLFIEAERRFGFNDIVDWMLHGEDDRLHEEELGRIRRVVLPARTNAMPEARMPVPPAAPPSAPDVLTLKCVFWSPARPVAVIGGCSFEIQDQARVRLGHTNVTLRCLAIRQDSARVRILETGEERELKLRQD